MAFTWDYVNDSNTSLLNAEGTAIASILPDQLVVIRQMPLSDIQKYYVSFKRELRENMYNALAMTPTEFSDWNDNSKYKFDPDICLPRSCVAFKRSNVGSNKLGWLFQAPVVSSSVDLGYLSASTPSGKARKNMIRGGGGSLEFAQRLSLEEQRTVLKRILLDDFYDFDEVLKFGQADQMAMTELDRIIQGAPFEDTAWTQITKLLSSFIDDQSAMGSDVGTGKGHGRRYAAPLFLAYLAREGEVLWPVRASLDSEAFVPRVFKPFLWTFFVPQKSRTLARALCSHRNLKSDLTYIFPVYRDLLFTTNFFSDASTLRAEQFLHLKARYHSPAYNSLHRAHGINIMFKDALAHFGLTDEDVRQFSDYFGGRRRIAADNGRDAFGWVDNPSNHQLSKYQEIFGKRPPEKFPDYVIRWAADLRLILSNFGVKNVKGKIDRLTPWLYYLISIGENYAPPSFEFINRERHINSIGNSAYTTYTDFLSQEAMFSGADQCVTTLRQAWTLAATRDGYAGKIACPIDPEIDAPKQDNGNRNKVGRTKRQSLDELVLETLIEENRRSGKDGEPFAFARSLSNKLGRRYDRVVIDSLDSRKKSVFWPALPILLDAILNMGMRKIMAQWMDSGEGDEFLVDPVSCIESPNPLPTATVGRRMSFLRLMSINNKETVVGSFFPINKSGPYETPWVDSETAQLITYMRDWQTRYYPRKTPVIAERDSLTKQYAAGDSIPAVYPLFRDPLSRSQSYPPTDSSIYRYWKDLLTHCEPIVNEKRKKAADAAGRVFRAEALLKPNGEPRWDIHSLRVTTVTTLIEAGVSPDIVALLVGHKSLAMTWHYVAVNNQKTNLALHKGMEERRKRAIAELDSLQTDEDVETAVACIFGGIINLRGDQAQGSDMLKDALISKEPGAYEVFAHGICPGGNCGTGGELYRNAYQPVFRPRACSRCRHRVTGPIFLNGLVHRLNALMVELGHCYEREADINRQLEIAEDSGGSTFILEGLVRREREERDNIWAEWCAELKTIRQAEALLDQNHKKDRLPLLTGMSSDDVKARFESVHQLALLHQMITEADVITGASLEVPIGTREKRDEMLLEIARHNDASSFFYKLAPQVRKRALNAFGDLLTQHAHLGHGRELTPDRIENLLQGAETLPQLREAAGRICLIAANGGGVSEPIDGHLL